MQTTSCIPSSSGHWDAFGAIWDASNIIFFIVGMRKYFSTICIPVVSAGWDANQPHWDAASGHPSAMPCLLGTQADLRGTNLGKTYFAMHPYYG